MMSFEEDVNLVKQISAEVKRRGGKAYFVGGYVRDTLLGIECKDIDVEIHGIKADVLEEILDLFGERIETGKSFGVYKICHSSVDFAMPRTEEASGRGHRDFKIFTDPFIGTQNAARRRDFTINSIMQDVLTGEITDHFGGAEDLKKGIIRHIDAKTFKEDELRVLRAAQFGARFNFDISPDTMQLCSEMKLDALSSERVFAELEKALLKAKKPSAFFEILRDMGHLSHWFKELKDLIGVEQNPKYHREGDVWTHTMMVLDSAAKLRDSVQNPVGFMLSALVHDLGKSVATEEKNGVIHAYNHETLGIPIVKSFLARITNCNDITKYVLNMTKLHMKPNMLYAHLSSVKATNKMFDASLMPYDLVCLALCDSMGKIPNGDYEGAHSFLTERLNIYHEYMSRPYVSGKDLIDAGINPSDRFKELLEYSHKLRLAGVEKQHALKQVLSYNKTEEI